MPKEIVLKILPEDSRDELQIKKAIAAASRLPLSAISGFTIRKSSIDARGKTIWIQLQVLAYLNEPFQPPAPSPIQFREAHKSTQKVIIVGSGPAGLFAALTRLGWIYSKSETETREIAERTFAIKTSRTAFQKMKSKVLKE